MLLSSVSLMSPVVNFKSKLIIQRFTNYFILKISLHPVETHWNVILQKIIAYPKQLILCESSCWIDLFSPLCLYSCCVCTGVVLFANYVDCGKHSVVSFAFWQSKRHRIRKGQSQMIFLRLVYPMLPVSLDCPFVIAPSVFYDVYFVKMQSWPHLRFSLENSLILYVVRKIQLLNDPRCFN
jgi:hypothetical protein